MSSQRLDPRVVVGSILEPDIDGTARALGSLPAGCGAIELRADRLRRDEVRALIGKADRPMIVTVRRLQDGGGFDGSEDERGAILQAALDGGTAFVDVEWGSPAAHLAAGPAADRVILSHHGAACTHAALRPLLRAMTESSAARLKLVPVAASPGDLGVLRELLAEFAPVPGRIAAFASGRAGMLSRLLALSWGSWATYGATRRGAETAEGQFTVRELIDIYAVETISARTRLHALIGTGVRGSPSPAMHAWAYRQAGLDARYFPIELEQWSQVATLVGERGVAGLRGLAVTRPFKLEAARSCTHLEPFAAQTGAVNTIRIEASAWQGSNTDGPACRALVQAGGVAAGARVAVLGAGGTARAATVALRNGGFQVVLFNRTHRRAAEVARELGVVARPLEELAAYDWEALIQATPLGAEGESAVEPAHLRGRLVVDAVYTSAAGGTPLIREARRRGLTTRDGIDWLAAQGALQCAALVGLEPTPRALASIARAWLHSADASPQLPESTA